MTKSVYFHYTPLQALALMGFALFSALVSTNPLLVGAALLTLMCFPPLIWRRGEPPILFFALFSQWSEVVTIVMQADKERLPLAEYAQLPEIETAVSLGLAGLLALAVGMRLALRGMRPTDMRILKIETARLSIPRIFFMHVATFTLSLLVKGLIWMSPRLTQILLAFFNVKWVFFFLLAYTVLLRREKRWMLFVSFALEVAVGMISFFSEFKQPFFILIIVYLSLGRRFSKARVFKAFVLAIGVILLGIMWSSVKTEYRDFINEGTGEQVATVPVPERISKIVNLYSSLRLDSLGDGTEKLLKRLSYVEFFAISIENVPVNIPFEEGKLLKAALMHVLMPRIFFPDKPVVDQTELTSRYTGLSFGEYTSVSLGYMPEAYIDFGYGMFVPIFVFGLVFGSMYRVFVSQSRVKVFGYLFACPVLMLGANFGTNQVILVGGVLMSFILMMIIMRFGSSFLLAWLGKVRA